MWASTLNLIESYWPQVVEVILLAIIFYYLLISVRGTKTQVLIQWIFVLLLLYALARLLHLMGIVRILEAILYIGPLAIIVIFVPEIRRFLERAGRTHRLLSVFVPTPGAEPAESRGTSTFEAVVLAVEELASRFHGALIAIEKEEVPTDMMVPGTWLSAQVSDVFLKAIFEPHNPLHDGAVIIRDDRVLYSSCFFPLSTREELDRDLGTRHRAAVGITEKVDCIVIVVSEERGEASIAYNGRLARDLNSRQFREQLRALYYENPNFATNLSRVSG